MRLHRLTVEGFGPFRDRQEVDFDRFADDGIFLIAGRTGAGKSSILDAVCFGLYGGVPRYDSGDKRLRSDHSEPDDATAVTVEFSTTAGRFRVTRSPAYERPAKRGSGMTTQAASAMLEELTENGWVGRGARAVDVGNLLADILQLTQEQFLQVILLAQNRFADFLLADSRERQKLLRRLFDTERFEDIQARFDERRRAAHEALSGRLARIDARLDEAERLVADADLAGEAPTADEATTAERIDALTRASARADYRQERLGAERDDAEKRLAEADAALATAREMRQAQGERDRARAALAALDAAADEIAAAARRRNNARAAESVRAVITAATKADAAVTTATQARDAALAAWSALPWGAEPAPESSWVAEPVEASPSPDPESSWVAEPVEASPSTAAARLRAWVTEQTQASGAWHSAAALEKTAPQRVRDLADAQTAVAAATARVADLEKDRVAIPAEIEKLTAERDADRQTAVRIGDLTRALEVAQDHEKGAADVDRLTAELAAAARLLADRTEAHERAQTDLARLRRRRLDGFAGELATALVDGEPCAVCGSTAHPAPAEHVDPVSADDVAAAEAARDVAAEGEKAASTAQARLDADLAAATVRAGGLTTDQASAAIAQAQAELAAAQTAEARAADITTAIAERERQHRELTTRLDEASAHVTSSREHLARVEASVASADEQIAAARGEHQTVADRLREATERIALATAAADAIDEHASRIRTAQEARADLDDTLDGSPFETADAAAAALLPAAEVAALDDRVTAHAVQREKERAILLDLELRTLPEEPIDLAVSTEVAGTARSAWRAAVDAATRAESVRDALAAAVRSAAAEQEASAEDHAAYDSIRALADALAGRAGNTHKMNLETFVLAAELEEIVAAANLRLADMSGGRYQLRHSDALVARGAASGLGIVVFDAFTGQTRPARSLSGGETFLSSLALALGLAEVVTARAGGIQLDTLFIDEGFGSLDGDTLEIAMRTLDELRQGGRTVGIISHVEAMQEQIPAQLTVRALPDGPSVIESPRVSGR